VRRVPSRFYKTCLAIIWVLRSLNRIPEARHAPQVWTITRRSARMVMRHGGGRTKCSGNRAALRLHG
jgi:hypothetical protein